MKKLEELKLSTVSENVLKEDELDLIKGGTYPRSCDGGDCYCGDVSKYSAGAVMEAVNMNAL